MSTKSTTCQGVCRKTRSSIVDQAAIPLSAYAKENRFKLYFFDVGMLGAISGLQPAVFMNYGFGSYQGYIAENFVAQELKASSMQSLYCWEGRTSEIEFLLERDDKIWPVEVKSGRVTKSKSLTVYEERYSPSRSFILSGKNRYVKNNREYIPIYDSSNLGHLMS